MIRPTPKILNTKTALAKVYLQTGQVDAAEQLADAVLVENPNSMDAMFVKGEVLLRRGNIADAISRFRTLVAEKPRFVSGYIRLAECHLKNNEISLAMDTLQSAHKMMPQSREVLKAMYRLALVKKDFKAAISRLEDILEQYPADVDVRAKLGDLLVATKDISRAETEYGKIRQDAPENPTGYLRLARLYGTTGAPEKAIAVLAEGYDQNPGSPVLLRSLVQFYILDKPIPGCGLCMPKTAGPGAG